jgi:hypothetical protein
MNNFLKKIGGVQMQNEGRVFREENSITFWKPSPQVQLMSQLTISDEDDVIV